MNGRDLTLGALAGLAVAGVVAQRRRGSRDREDERIEAFDDHCRDLDYSLMQEGGDIGRRFDRHGGLGYHDTSPERARQIKIEGLGSHPGKTYGETGGGIEGHEIDFWMCAWSDREEALGFFERAQRARTMEQNRDIAEDIAAHLRERHPDLKAVWFYVDPDAGGISKYAGARCSFDLRKVVDWLADHAEDGPYLFGNEDMGYALSWRGPSISPKLLKWVRA